MDADLCSVEIVQAHLDRIARVEPALNAIVTLRAEAALAEAGAADRARAGGRPLGALHGLSVGLKEARI